MTFGKAITSRSELSPKSSMTSRSSPKAKPACGGVPYPNACTMKPKRVSISSAEKPSAENICCCTSLRWMRTLPLPSSTPFSTTS